jgi:hypothetical protein
MRDIAKLNLAVFNKYTDFLKLLIKKFLRLLDPFHPSNLLLPDFSTITYDAYHLQGLWSGQELCCETLKSFPTETYIF